MQPNHWCTSKVISLIRPSFLTFFVPCSKHSQDGESTVMVSECGFPSSVAPHQPDPANGLSVAWSSFLTAIPMSLPSVSAQSKKPHWMCKKSSASDPIGVCSLESDIIMFSLYHYYLPLGKSLVLHMKKTCIPITQGCFVTSLVEIGPVGSGEEEKRWKFTTMPLMDNG